MFAAYSAYTSAQQKVVVINPGHSIGWDSGASSKYKSEAQVNQELAGRLVRVLNQRGYKVYITHTLDEELKSQKLLDQESGSSLKAVGSATNSVNPDLVLSIHHNSGGTSSSGTELYWSSYRSFDADGVYTVSGLWGDGSDAYRDSSPCPAAQQSERFAQILKSKLEGGKLPFRKIQERDDYLPAHATAPCVLYEGGFLSNPTEAEYLASDAYMIDASNRLANAIDEFLGGSGSSGSGSSSSDNKQPEPTPEPPVTDKEAPKITSVSSSVTSTGDTTFSIFATVTDNIGVTKVRFATWTEYKGQDDIIWTSGTNDGNNNWSCVVDISKHNNETGIYKTHVYAYDAAGNYVGVIAPEVTVSKNATSPGLSIQQVNSFIANAYAYELGGESYKFAVWSEEDGQDDLIWSDGTEQVNGSTECAINREDHGSAQGKYFVHCYTQDFEFVGGNEIDFGTINTEELSAQQVDNTIEVKINGIDAPYGIQKVRVACWSEANDQDDLIWYEAKGSETNYNRTIKLSNHNNETGNYWIHTYLVDDYGLQEFIGSTKVTVSGQEASDSQPEPSESIPTLSVEKKGNQAIVTINNVADGLKVVVPIWSEANGQDDVVWYEANRQGSSYIATASISAHPGLGTHFVHAYIMNNDGSLIFLGESTYNVDSVDQPSSTVTVDTPVMGNSMTSANQLVNFYNNVAGHAFPDYYVVRGVSLAQFAQMYVEEAEAEGVRADIAFAQAMHETAFLGFGGDVSISQFNFAGLGATGNGVAGENFAATYGDNANGIRMGIRAQIQHLKAYASTDPLNQECVDNRFTYVTRGCAPTIAGLGGKWAVDQAYATKLVRYINQIQ